MTLQRPKRAIVCGGRDYADAELVFEFLDHVLEACDPGCLTIIQGGASGADKLARDWCEARNVPCITFDADWKKHGRVAGPIRNLQMIVEGKADILVAFPGGRGTANMVKQAQKARLKIFDVGRIEDDVMGNA